MIKNTIKFYKENRYFELGSAFEFGVAMARELDEMFERGTLTGRMCNLPHDYGLLAQVIFNAGHGNHLEIGTLWGASAIIAGMTKRKYKLRGDIYCVDPLDGLYKKGKTDKYAGRILATETTLKENLKVMILNAKIITKKSIPFPAELDSVKFVSAYIDGDHWGQAPQQDLENAVERTTKYIILDNYDKLHPAVVDAVRGAEWTLVYLESIMAVLQNPKLARRKNK